MKKIDRSLLAISKFTVAGNESVGIEVVTNESSRDYDWVLYVAPNLRVQVSPRKEVPKDLYYLGVSGSGRKLRFSDDPHDSEDMRNASLYKLCICCVAGSMDVKTWYHDSSHNNTEYRVLTRGGQWGDTLATPFLSVGTKFPKELSQADLENVLSLLGNPIGLNCIITGSYEAATSVLSSGLVGLRSLILDHFGIIPGENSAPIDMNLPFPHLVYREGEKFDFVEATCSAVDHVNYVREDLVYSVSCYVLSMLYNLIEADHGYRAAEPLEKSPEHRSSMTWEISTSSTKTRVPYRYPALVSLLSELSKYKQLMSGNDTSNAGEPVGIDINGAIMSARRHGLLTGLPILTAPHPPSEPMLEAVIRSTSGFMVQLYRLTCKGIITMPDKATFPRRSEAARKFEAVYKGYAAANSLSDFLTLGKSFIAWSLCQQRGLMRSSRATGKSPIELLTEATTPPIILRGELQGSDSILSNSAAMLRWEQYERLLDFQGEVIFDCSGELKSLKDIVKDETKASLGKLALYLESQGTHSAIGADLAYVCSTFYGLEQNMRKNGHFITKMLTKIKVNTPLLNCTLEDVLNYYRCTGDISLRDIIEAVVSCISAALLDNSLASSLEGSNKGWVMSDHQIVALAALREHLTVSLDAPNI